MEAKDVSAFTKSPITGVGQYGAAGGKKAAIVSAIKTEAPKIGAALAEAGLFKQAPKPERKTEWALALYANGRLIPVRVARGAEKLPKSHDGAFDVGRVRDKEGAERLLVRFCKLDRYIPNAYFVNEFPRNVDASDPEVQTRMVDLAISFAHKLRAEIDKRGLAP